MTTTTLKVKQNDSGRTITDVLRDQSGVINLTGATVKFLARNAVSNTVIINAAATVTSAVGGAVAYSLTAADTASTGQYAFEWQITFSDGAVFTVPTSGYHRLVVGDDIAQ